ncbi:hypothetical protein ACIGW3_12650 [Streptomyces sp. NPDC053499]|uniref:hypothetical protein n=1 Tax=Streptomyces sp. NPDC053499 TaxID=3365707 RepID=UPI0037D79D42
MTGRRRHGRVCLALLGTSLVLAAVAGCGGSDSDADGKDSAKPAASRPGEGRSSAAAGPTPKVTAADGSDPAACTDGNCEIAVSDPVTVRFKVAGKPAKLSLTQVGENEVGYKVTSGSSRTSGEASGKGSGCTAVFRSGGSNSVCGPAGKPPDKVDGAVVVQVASGADGTAILRLVSD